MDDGVLTYLSPVKSSVRLQSPYSRKPLNLRSVCSQTAPANSRRICFFSSFAICFSKFCYLLSSLICSLSVDRCCLFTHSYLRVWHSIVEDQTNTERSMSNPDPFQEILDSRVLTSTSSTMTLPHLSTSPVPMPSSTLLWLKGGFQQSSLSVFLWPWRDTNGKKPSGIRMA